MICGPPVPWRRTPLCWLVAADVDNCVVPGGEFLLLDGGVPLFRHGDATTEPPGSATILLGPNRGAGQRAARKMTGAGYRTRPAAPSPNCKAGCWPRSSKRASITCRAVLAISAGPRSTLPRVWGGDLSSTNPGVNHPGTGHLEPSGACRGRGRVWSGQGRPRHHQATLDGRLQWRTPWESATDFGAGLGPAV
jgi:hypothetical protein